MGPPMVMVIPPPPLWNVGWAWPLANCTVETGYGCPAALYGMWGGRGGLGAQEHDAVEESLPQFVVASSICTC